MPACHKAALLCLQVSHGAIQFMVYEELKAASLRAGRGHLSGQGDKMHALSSIDISVIGAVSKLAASLTTYPTQVPAQDDTAWGGAGQLAVCCNAPSLKVTPAVARS